MSEQKLFKMKTTPSDKKLFAYMAAILEVTGMDQGKPFPLGKFFGNMRTHLENGRFMRVPEGYQLTAKGKDYFNDRYSVGNPQHIDRGLVEVLIEAIKTGGPTWEEIA